VNRLVLAVHVDPGAWIAAHDGQPEARVPAASTRGLHGSRLNGSAEEQSRPPLRFVLPAGTLT